MMRACTLALLLGCSDAEPSGYAESSVACERMAQAICWWTQRCATWASPEADCDADVPGCYETDAYDSCRVELIDHCAIEWDTADCDATPNCDPCPTDATP